MAMILPPSFMRRVDSLTAIRNDLGCEFLLPVAFRNLAGIVGRGEDVRLDCEAIGAALAHLRQRVFGGSLILFPVALQSARKR